MLSLNNLTVNQFKALTGVHFTTKMNGKMQGMESLSTSCNVNPHCIARMKDNNSICSHCFSHAQMNCFKSMNAPLEKNAEILTANIFDVDDMPIINCLYFRFEAFGDLINYKQVANYFNLCRKNPAVNFALWTKNPWIIDECMTIYGYEKPDNLNIVYSSPILNVRMQDSFLNKYPFIDKIFTVYDAHTIENENIKINCGARSCIGCGLCYTKNDVRIINEKLK